MLRAKAFSSKSRSFPCTKLGPDGQPCPSVLTKKWNLKRHEEQFHTPQGTTFVYCSPGEKKQSRVLHPPSAVDLESPTLNKTGRGLTVGPPGSVSSQASTPTAFPQAHPGSIVLPRSESECGSPRYPVSIPSPATRAIVIEDSCDESGFPSPTTLMKRSAVVASPTGSSPARSSGQNARNLTLEAATQDATTNHSKRTLHGVFRRAKQTVSDGLVPMTREDSCSRELNPVEETSGTKHLRDVDAESPAKKRQKTALDGSRKMAAFLKEDMPVYEVKQDKNLDQQKAIEWLTSAGKENFDTTYATLLAGWGVKPGHRGTCVLVPEDWRMADPPDMMALFNERNYPDSKATRAWYSGSGHGAYLVRALAWFSQWPRTGLQLDNFLGSGPFKPLDASHLCHHGSCIVHIVYEGAHINCDREQCRTEARRLRQNGKPVPEGCTLHHPPCMMQHASLTTRETYYIQFDVLCRARGFPPMDSGGLPRRYLYPTYESKLPTIFSSVNVDNDTLISEAPPGRKVTKIGLKCPFCVDYRIKTYATAIGLWSHIYNKHQGIDDEKRLQEILKSGETWRRYWEDHSDGGKRGHPTMEKLIQMQEPDFGWKDIVAWELR